MSSPERIKPFYPEHILPRPYIPHTAVGAMETIYTAAKLGRYGIADLLFAGIDGSTAAHNGTFGDEESIHAVTYNVWAAEAGTADRTRTVSYDPYHTALQSISLPTVVVLKKSRMEQMDPLDDLWSLGDDIKRDRRNNSTSAFDLVVASVVYIIDDDKQLSSLRHKTGIPAASVHKPKQRFMVVPRGARVVDTTQEAIRELPPNASRRTRLRAVPPINPQV